MSEALSAAVYCRMSLAVMGDTTKVEDQERICRELCERLGWRVHDVYADNNKSAWQKNRKRPAWDRMLADVDAGLIGAIVVYHGDRLVRRPQDLAKLIELADSKGLRLASPTGTRNLDNGDDRFIVWIEAAAQERSSYDTSRRKITQYERMRREGKVRPGGRGGRSYGFRGDNLTMIESEAANLREAAARILGGEGAGAVAADFTARGIVTQTGIPFTYATLPQLLKRPRYAGLMPDGVQQAAWEPVLERSQWEALRAVLGNRSAGYGYAVNSRRYLLSGIAECGFGDCGAPLQIRHTRVRGDGPPNVGYACIRPGCRKTYRSRVMLDAYVSQRVVSLLNQEGNPEPAAPRTPGLAERYAAADAQRREIEEVLADPSRGSVPALLKRLDRVNATLAELRDLSAGDARSRLRTRYAGLTLEEFRGLPLAVRRSLVAAYFRVVVLPSSKKGPGFRTEDVRMIPRG
jgi:DNA invertase Pin-like site-specific DNA recombinase